MFKKSLICILAVTALMNFASCSKEIEYNSNTGHDGSRDSASQLLVNTNKVDEISAIEGDHEDWFYFTPPEKGLIGVSIFVDKPAETKMQISVMDGFGRTLHELSSNTSQNVYDFIKFEVNADRYFIAVRASEGKSSYTLKADFEVPPPPMPEPEIVAEPADDAPKTSRRSSCVPADKCKSGQKCCKPKATASDDEISPTDKTVKGTVVLVTQRGSDLCDIKISGIGSKNKVQKGAKAVLRGLNRKVDIYQCQVTSCHATVRATSEELAHYDTVDVVVP